jgi:ribosomal protein L13
MESITNDLIYRGLETLPPTKDPQSCYVAINHKGETWHLFNAARIPLGRMAALIAVYIRGKHKPIYDSTKPDLGDNVVVVNASHLKIGGKKLD